MHSVAESERVCFQFVEMNNRCEHIFQGGKSHRSTHVPTYTNTHSSCPPCAGPHMKCHTNCVWHYHITCSDWDLEFRWKLYHSSMSVFEVINEWSGCRDRNFCSSFDMYWEIFQNKITLQSKYLYNCSIDSFRIHFSMWK